MDLSGCDRICGRIDRASNPAGADHIGIIATIVVGIVGSRVGGFIGGMIKKPTQGSGFHPAGFFLSIVGAVILLLLWRMIA